ncbi:MAG: sigma-70 family RNA polymerase sigma factor [Candidatus Melainabacteria bacterium]|nr:sigma-70 family RNA polymerase sigma factor [Candidatus Melainabacteria bacterium]
MVLRSKHRRFKELTYGYFHSLYRMAYARLANVEDAEDVVQETYFKAFRSFDTFRDGTNYKAWLIQILINTVRDHIRKEGRTLPAIPLDETIHAASQQFPSPEEELSANELDPQLLAALKSLPETFVTPLLLRELNLLSYQEIADTLNIPIGTVMSRLSRSRDLLRKRLEATIQLTDNPPQNAAQHRNLTTS